MHVQPVYGAGALRRNHVDAVSSTHPRDSEGISSASPLDVDGMVEVRSTRGRKPMSVEIVSHASEIRDTASLWDAMVVFCDLTSVPLVTAGLAHGAKEARILSDVQAVADYAQKHFRFPTQRVVGGTVPVVDPDTTDREPLSDQEFAEVSAVYAEARTEMETAEQEVQRLERVARLLQKSFAAPYKSLGRLSNPARSTAALQKQLVDAAASLADASATVARVQRLVQTRSKPRGAIPADLRAEWRMPVATNFHALMNNRVLLLTDTGGAVEALDPLVGAKRLIMCCFANLNAVRERVLAWWSSVSTIDAHQHPDINTRIVLVCGSEPTVRAKEPRASSMGLTMRVKVTVPMGAKGGSTMELTGNGGIKHEVTIPEGLLEGEPFDAVVPLSRDSNATDSSTHGQTNRGDEDEDEGELAPSKLLAGVLLFQLMQCADVEMSDLSPDGLTRRALRTVIEASRGDDTAGRGHAGQEQGWGRLRSVLERQVVRQGLAETERDVAELCVVGQYTAVPSFAPNDSVFRPDPLAGMSADLRFDESIRHKL